jgi:hypothetical protein
MQAMNVTDQFKHLFFTSPLFAGASVWGVLSVIMFVLSRSH